MCKVKATTSNVTPGTVLVADGGFDCLKENGTYIVERSASGELAVQCSEGEHFLDGQLNDADEYVGFTLKEHQSLA